MVVVVGGFAPSASINDADAPALEIDGAGDFEVLTNAAGTFAYVAGNDDDGLSVFRVAADGALTNVQNLSNSATLPLADIDNMTTATVGGRTFLYVKGDTADTFDHGIACFEVGADGLLTYLQRQAQTDVAPFLGSPGDIQTFNVGGTTFLYARGEGTVSDPLFRVVQALNVYRVEADGKLTSTSWQEKGSYAEETAVVTVGGHTYLIEPIGRLFQASGINVYEMKADGTAVLVEAFGGDINPEVGVLTDVVTATIGGTTFVVTGNLISGVGQPPSLCVMTIDANGQLASIAQPQAVLDLVPQGEINISIFTLGGDTFVTMFDGAPVTDLPRLITFRLDGSGMLTPVSSAVFDEAWFALNGDISVTIVDGQPVLIGTHYIADTVQTFLLGGGDDTLAGGATDDLLLGYGGDDTMTGDAGADTLDGGAGDDWLAGGLGSDTINGGDGNDTITDGSDDGNSNALNGGAGDDRLVNTFVDIGGLWDGGAGNDTIDFSPDTSIDVFSMNLSGASFLLFGTTFKGFENATGHQGADNIVGTSAANRLDGQGGTDHLKGLDGIDRLLGAGGDDVLEGGAGKDVLVGGNGIDTLSYVRSALGVSVDLATGTATGGDAQFDRFANFENLTGSSKADTLSGNDIANVITGLGGADILAGGLGNDRLEGGNGHDRLEGGDGVDTLDGGAGRDVFVLATAGHSRDVVKSFVVADDTLEVDTSAFGGGLSAGTALLAGQLARNADGLAHDANDRFILNTATGQLYFDANGSAAGERFMVATFVDIVPVLTVADFAIL